MPSIWIGIVSLALLSVAEVSQAQSPRVPSEIAAYENTLADECRQLGGTPRGWTSAGFHQQADLTGDGIQDWIFDEGGYQCDGAASIYCGSGSHGCQVKVFIGLPKGNARLAFENGAFGFSIERKGSAAVLYLGVAGPLCGQRDLRDFASAIHCDRPVLWNSATRQFEFAPLSSVRHVSGPNVQ
jgi:hypothetical protein